MTRRTYRIMLGALVALAAPATLTRAARGDDAVDKTPEAKALAADAGLRAQLTTPTLAKLKQHSPKAQINGKTYYFVEGDLRRDEDQLLFYAMSLDAQHAKYKRVKQGIAIPSPAGGQLMLHVVDGKVMRWEPGSTLTYCVLKQTFAGDEYDKAVTNMKEASKNWEKTCNIKLEHAEDKDDATPAATPPAGVTFTVRKVDEADGPIASAFFPGDPAADRHLLLFPDYFTTGFDQVGVLRHELGHVLGFRHEHIRSEAPAVCQGEPIFEAIPATEYDPNSVMHYFCGGSGTLELAITALDRLGARGIYGAPMNAGLEAPPQGPIDFRNDALKKRFNNIRP